LQVGSEQSWEAQGTPLEEVVLLVVVEPVELLLAPPLPPMPDVDELVDVLVLLLVLVSPLEPVLELVLVLGWPDELDPPVERSKT
jgi:hypothetical protein